MRTELLLPAGTNLVHIGPQKTGSTAAQSALHEAREALRAHGVIYPGPYQKPIRAVEAGLGIGMSRGRMVPRMHAWQDLLNQIERDNDDLVCVSHEGLARLDEERVEKAVRALGGDRPHILIVARRYDRYLPSQWQQRIRARSKLSYDEWLRIVLDPAKSHIGAHRNVWIPHDTPALVQRWAQHAGIENVSVVAGNEADRRQLLSTFESLLGLPAGLLVPAPDGTNRSLSYQETELLRRVNLSLRDADMSDTDWRYLFVEGMIPYLAGRSFSPTHDATPTPPSWAWDRIQELSDQRIARLEVLGVRILGSLSDLRVDPSGSSSSADPRADELDLSTAARAITGVVAGAVTARHAWECSNPREVAASAGQPTKTQRRRGGRTRRGRLVRRLRRALGRG